MMLVESWVPPIPTSTTATSTCKMTRFSILCIPCLSVVIDPNDNTETVPCMIYPTTFSPSSPPMYLFRQENIKPHYIDKDGIGAGHEAIVFALCSLKLFVDFPKVCRKLSFADWLPVDANPLANFHQMWRTIYWKDNIHHCMQYGYQIRRWLTK